MEFGSSEGFKKALATENHVIEGSKVSSSELHFHSVSQGHL